MRIKPVRIPAGRVVNCEMKSEGTRNLFDFVSSEITSLMIQEWVKKI